MNRPIIFSAPMVRALLDGRKTMTRRVLKPQPDDIPVGQIPSVLRISTGYRLYVREAWRTFASMDDAKPRDIWHHGCGHGAGIMYEADQHGLAITKDGERFEGPRDDPNAFGKLRSPMFMPRWASRITLLVTEVRIQRLQEISEDDAFAEGIPEEKCCGVPTDACGAHIGGCCGQPEPNDLIALYRELWDRLNAARGCGWGANPWVAAYTFKPILGNIDSIAVVA